MKKNKDKIAKLFKEQESLKKELTSAKRSYSAYANAFLKAMRKKDKDKLKIASKKFDIAIKRRSKLEKKIDKIKNDILTLSFQ